MARALKSATKTPRVRENPEKSYTNCQFKPVHAKTEKQAELVKAIKNSTIIFAKGPAGTGKSHIAISMACEGLLKGKYDRILISRPMVPAAYEDVGALPGDINDKFTLPYIGPVRPIFDSCIGKGHVDMYIKEGKITCSPLAFMRGSTHNRTCMILDEAQNCIPEQVKMFITRLGEGSTVIINGDAAQSDIRGVNGLDDAIARLKWHPDIAVVEFGRGDIVRHSIISDILQSYEDDFSNY